MRFLEFFFLAARILIGSIYLYAGFTKLTEPVENFIGVITSYEIIPYFMAAPVAYILPWFEVIFGSFLILGYLTRVSVLVVGLISLSFVGLMALTYLKTGAFPANCGCFGEGSPIHFTGGQILILDSAVVLLTLAMVFRPSHPLSLDALLNRSV